MRLAKYRIIILGLSSLLFSCAQLGTIDGGAKDITAPQIVQSTPQNGSTNFNQNIIEFQFDEYFQLSNPQTTITIAPNHSRVKSTNSGKKIRVEFLDSLQANTTYQLLFNGAIKDINEGNDSLMVFVFSTGTTLDSAYYQTTIIDAFTSQPVKKVFVGLFDTLANAPKYLQKSNERGMASFSFIKPGSYSVRAWEDFNSNGEYDSVERVAFRSEVLILRDSIKDSIPLRLAKPEFEKTIRSAAFIEPGLVGLTVNNLEKGDQFYFQNEAVIKNEELMWKGKDSLLLAFNSNMKPSAKLFIQHVNGTLDSIKIVSTSEEMTSLKIKSNSNWVKINAAYEFELSDFITQMDKTKIIVQDKTTKDTLQLETTDFSANQIKINDFKTDSKEIDFTFETGAFTGKTGLKSARLKTSISRFSDRELGVLQVDVSRLDSTDLVQLIFNNKVVESQNRGNKKQLDFTNLLPGEYSFRVIRDYNNNLRWDGWNMLTKSPPEKVMWFTQPTKVRANWEIKTDLVPKNE
jgi:uncharacterized protein (DUF2141 family)